MQLSRLEGDVGRNHPHIQVFLIVTEDRVAISKATGSNMSKFVNKVTGIMRCDSTFVDLVKIIPNLPVQFEKEFYKKFAATLIADIGKRHDWL